MKLTVIGAGTIGSGVAYNAAIRDVFDDIVIVDLNREKAEGEAFDISHALPFHSDTRVRAGDYADALDSNVVAMTAGKPRKEGMTRSDLLEANVSILESVFEHDFNDDAVFVTTTNPMDVINYSNSLISDLPRERFVGFGGWLDSARMRYILGQYLDESPHDVKGFVIGQHGETQVPVFSRVTVDGRPVDIPAEDREKLREQMRESAMGVISRKGGTQWAPTLGVADMLESIATDSKQVIPCSSVLDGEYGHSGISIGVPAVIGSRGVEDIIELDLSEWEQERFDESATNLKELCTDAATMIEE